MALLTAPFPQQDTNWVSQIVQAGAQMRQRQEEAQRNYALQIQENARREAEAKERMQFDRLKSDELARQFEINTAFNKGKDMRDAAYDSERTRLLKTQADAGEHGNAIEPGLPVQDPLQPSGSASDQIAGIPSPGDPSFIGPVDPAQATVLPPLPDIQKPGAAALPSSPAGQIVGSPAPAAPARAAAAAAGKPFAPATSAANVAALSPPRQLSPIEQLNQTLIAQRVPNKAREAALASAAERIAIEAAKPATAEPIPIADIAAKFGLTRAEDGTYQDAGGIVYQVGYSAGKPSVKQAKTAVEAGLIEDPKNPGVFTKPGSGSLFKKDADGNFFKVGTEAKRAATYQDKETGEPITQKTDGSFENSKGQKVQPEKIVKVGGQLDDPKFEESKKKDTLALATKDRDYAAGEATKARKEQAAMREKADLIPVEPVARDGKYYASARATASEITKADYDSRKARVDAHNAKLREIESRIERFDNQVKEAEAKLSSVAPAAPTPAGPGVLQAPPASARPKYVWKNGKLVTE